MASTAALSPLNSEDEVVPRNLELSFSVAEATDMGGACADAGDEATAAPTADDSAFGVR